jgi:hypothetical protein
MTKNNKVGPRQGLKGIFTRVRKSRYAFGGKSSTKNKKTLEHSLIDPCQTIDQADSSISFHAEEEEEEDTAECPKYIIPTSDAEEMETDTKSVVIQLFAEPKTAPLSSSKPAFFLSAALLFWTLFVTIFGAYLEGHLDHVQLPSFEKPTPGAFAYFQPIVDTVGSQPTVDSLFSLTW